MAGRVSHPLDDKRSFMEPSHPPFPFDQQCLVAQNSLCARFTSAENRKKFAMDRNKYLPQYGGYCAKAVSEKKFADIDPFAYKIVDGKLYLNYDRKIQKIWEEDIPGRIAEADKTWPELRASKSPK